MSGTPDHNSLLHQLMDNMTDNIFFKDLDSKFILVNKSNAEWVGFESPEHAIGKTDFDLFTKEFAEGARRDEQKIHTTGLPLVCKEEHANWGEGKQRWISTTKIPFRDSDGNIAGCIGIGRDITEQKIKEKELQAANLKLRETNKRLQEAHDQISEDLSMAARLQQTFLPQDYPLFENAEGDPRLDFHHYYEPDSAIGGDFCAVHQLSDTKAGLMICDVMGHGVRAALVTSMIRTIADNLSNQTESPAEFLTIMNRRLHPMLQTEDDYIFATACYLTIDVSTGILEGAMAGHTTPFLIQPRLAKVTPIEIAKQTAGPALAILPDHEYTPFSLQMAPGDEILMYTDGICEALNADLAEFGEKHLQRTVQGDSRLPLKELLPQILKTVRCFAEKKKLGDDICLLGFTLKSLMENAPSPLEIPSLDCTCILQKGQISDTSSIV